MKDALVRGRPVSISDINGDVTGLSRAGDATAEPIRERSPFFGEPEFDVNDLMRTS